MTYRVLIVDDEPTLGETFARVLSALGYDVATAADPSSAYLLLEDQEFHAVLLDMRLGSTMGDALYFALTRQWPYLRGRVILMSGADSPPSGEWPVELESCPFLLKPFSLEVLARTIASVLPAPERRRHDTA
ncbi:MAG TPA: response regulator [Gemmatimonadales bacterium]|jgi:DNA-binding NtrC family response regulator|nr:response regulator [Gemmatimonadales bacterium]